MARPSKPSSVIKMEGRSHRTKAELASRAKAEAGMLSGRKMKRRPEILENEDAKKEYVRVSKLLTSIDKNDALYEAVINRYCIIFAEEKDLVRRREEVWKLANKLTEDMESCLEKVSNADAIDIRMEYTRQINAMLSKMLEIDKMIEKKRKALMDIEKENVMTIASSLRSIPKKQESKTSALEKALGGVS